MDATLTRPVLLKPREAAEILGLSVDTLNLWRCQGRYAAELPYLKVGRFIKYDEQDVLRFLQSCRVVRESVAPRRHVAGAHGRRPGRPRKIAIASKG